MIRALHEKEKQNKTKQKTKTKKQTNKKISVLRSSGGVSRD